MSLFQKMTRPATAAALAAALALSPVTAAPARADTGSEILITGAIMGLIAGGLAAAVTTSNNTPRTVVPNTKPSYGYTPPRHTPPHYTPPRHTPRPSYTKTLPSNCVIAVGRGSSAATYLGQTCLDRNYAGARYLPSQCKTRMVNGNSGNVRQVYSGACLERAGYRVSARRW